MVDAGGGTKTTMKIFHVLTTLKTTGDGTGPKPGLEQVQSLLGLDQEQIRVLNRVKSDHV